MLEILPLKQILTGLFTSALWKILSSAAGRTYELLREEPVKRPLYPPHHRIAAHLEKAFTNIAEEYDLEGRPRFEEVCLFLNTPEAVEYVRQLYSINLLNDNKSKNIDLVRDEFFQGLSRYLDTPKKDLPPWLSHLFSSLLIACDKSLEIAISNGLLSAHEAQSSLRFRILRDAIQNIQRNLEIFTTSQIPSKTTLEGFETSYRRQINAFHNSIIPPHFNAATKVPIKDLYVPNDFEPFNPRRVRHADRIALPTFLHTIYRTVVLGDPGSGKTTFTNNVCYHFTTEPSTLFASQQQVIPIHVVLKDFGAAKKKRDCSILDYIESIANSTYQVPPPKGAIEYILVSGRGLVIFDGMDELIDSSYRREISSNIESFCNLFPSVPVLVTSRIVGYEQAPLDNKRFSVFRIAPYTEQQVEEYVRKWFSYQEDLTSQLKDSRANSFVKESQTVPDLRTNPLMLALMCNLYREEGYIPKNRPDVYEKCSLMLFERWDKSRGIDVKLPFDAHVRPTMMHLAHWIYGEEPLQSGVSESKLVQKASEYLYPARYDSIEQAEHAARDFIEYCKGRAWVFTDTGITKAGENLYQFTHRTFLEYFTAAYLVRIHSTVDKLLVELVPRIIRREWDVVAQIAIQIKSNQMEGAADDILTEITTLSKTKKGAPGWNLISFSVRCLEFLVPSRVTLRGITRTFIERLIDGGIENLGKQGLQDGKSRRKRRRYTLKGFNRSDLFDYYRYLFSASIENRKTITEEIISYFEEAIATRPDSDSLNIIAELGALHLMMLAEGEQTMQPGQKRKLTNRIKRLIQNDLEFLCGRNIIIAIYAAFYEGWIGVTQLISWMGMDGLFKYRESYIFEIGFPTISEYVLSSILREGRWYKKKKKKIDDSFSVLGEYFLEHEAPWVRGEKSGRHYIYGILTSRNQQNEVTRILEDLGNDDNFWFGLFGVLAILSEIHKKKNLEAGMGKLFPSPLRRLNELIIMRNAGTDESRMLDIFKQYKLNARQVTIMKQWVMHEVDFVRMVEIR